MRSIRSLSMLLLLVLAATGHSRAADPTVGDLKLYASSRVETSEGSGQFECAYKTLHWDPKQTAIIICDMWDHHWCKGAAARVAEMAPRINDFITEARRRGVLIVHAPSECMKAYEEPSRPAPSQDTSRGSNFPISCGSSVRGLMPRNGSNGPSTNPTAAAIARPHVPSRRPWKKQIDTIKIADEDAISDSGVEIASLFAQRGIDNVMLVGVHENMCVIGRSFGLRNMVRLGKNVVLVRDLTDAMYNPRMAPHVSHRSRHRLGLRAHRKVHLPHHHQQRPVGRPGLPFQGGQAAARHADRQRRRVFQRADPAGLRTTLARAVRLLLHAVGERKRQGRHPQPGRVENHRRDDAVRPPPGAAQGATRQDSGLSRCGQAAGGPSHVQPRLRGRGRQEGPSRMRSVARVRPRRARRQLHSYEKQLRHCEHRGRARGGRTPDSRGHRPAEVEMHVSRCTSCRRWPAMPRCS